MLPPNQLKLVKKTLPLFKKQGNKVALELYREVFKVDKNLRDLFSVEFLTPRSHLNCPNNSQSTETSANLGLDTLAEPLSPQARILANTIVDFAHNIDDLSAFESAIDRICNKHVSRDIRPEHYTVVAAAFGAAMKTVFGNEMTADEYGAWNSAVMALAGVFIEREKKIREAAKARPGGWEGWREFVLREKQHAVSGTPQLVLEAKDGEQVCSAGKGQFACARVAVEGFGTVHYNVQLSSVDEDSGLSKRGNEAVPIPGASSSHFAVPRKESRSEIFDLEKKTSVRSGPTSSSPVGMKVPQSSPMNNTRSGCPFQALSLSSAPSDCRSPANQTRTCIADTGSPTKAYSTTMPDQKLPPADLKEKAQYMTLVSPGKLVRDKAISGAPIELSVPVGGGGFMDINEQTGGSKTSKNGLLRQVHAKNSKPLFRPALNGKNSLAPPMAGGAFLHDMKKKSSSSRLGMSELSPTSVAPLLARKNT